MQRVPATEKRGRRHSSDITVVWLEKSQEAASALHREEVREEFLKTSGPGGQNKNKRETAVRLTHIPTGLQVVADGERSQGQNRQVAWERLEAKLVEEARTLDHALLNDDRRASFGAPATWIWTEWRDSVTTSTGKRGSYLQALKGNLGKLLRE